MLEHLIDESVVKEIDVIDQGQLQPSLMHAGIKRQVELRKVFLRQRPRFNERDGLGGAGQANLFGKVQQIEVNLKDRRATQVSLRPQLFDQFFKGHILVRESFQHCQAHAREQFAKARIA